MNGSESTRCRCRPRLGGVKFIDFLKDGKMTTPTGSDPGTGSLLKEIYSSLSLSFTKFSSFSRAGENGRIALTDRAFSFAYFNLQEPNLEPSG